MLRRTYATGPQREILKFYYDFKSPYTYLALQSALDLEKNYAVRLRVMPWPFRPEESFGGNLQERNKLNWNKVRYLYLDCRRFANERGLIIRGPQRLFDSRLSLIAGLYADQHRFFASFAQQTFERFFQRKLNLEDADEIIQLLYETSSTARPKGEFSDEFHAYLEHQGAIDYAQRQDEAEQDGIFGVPAFVVRGELFWGNDRLPWIEKRLQSLGLSSHRA